MSKRTLPPGFFLDRTKDGRELIGFVVNGPRRPNGKRRQVRRRGFASLKDAKTEHAKVVAKLDEGTFVEPSRQLFGDYLGEWLDAIRAKVRPSTHYSYRRKVDEYVRPRIGGIRLAHLSASNLNIVYADLLATGGRGGRPLSPRTILYTHAVIRKALADAVRWGRIARNVADGADPPKHRTPEMHTWTADDVRSFLRHVERDRLAAVWRLAATTGMRRGELLGLRWPDLDLDAGRVAIRRSLVMAGSVPAFSDPKTARGRRSVALDRGTVAAIREHRKRQAEERLAFGPAYRDGDLVFAQEDGSPIDPDRFTKMFTGHVRAAGLPRIRLHDLRHTHATLALAAGVHPKVVSERLGHATVSLTLDTYSHAIPALEEEAAEKVAEIVFGG
jgi:integrase